MQPRFTETGKIDPQRCELDHCRGNDGASRGLRQRRKFDPEGRHAELPPRSHVNATEIPYSRRLGGASSLIDDVIALLTMLGNGYKRSAPLRHPDRTTTTTPENLPA